METQLFSILLLLVEKTIPLYFFLFFFLDTVSPTSSSLWSGSQCVWH